jgi:hypothetical protein
MTRAWRRTATVRVASGPELRAAVFEVAAEQLTLTFRQDVQVTGPLGGVNLAVSDGVQVWEWQSTVDVSGPVIVTQHAHPVADGYGPGIQYLATPPAVLDLLGQPWAVGLYRVELVV